MRRSGSNSSRTSIETQGQSPRDGWCSIISSVFGHVFYFIFRNPIFGLLKFRQSSFCTARNDLLKQRQACTAPRLNEKKEIWRCHYKAQSLAEAAKSIAVASFGVLKLGSSPIRATSPGPRSLWPRAGRLHIMISLFLPCY